MTWWSDQWTWLQLNVSLYSWVVFHRQRAFAWSTWPDALNSRSVYSISIILFMQDTIDVIVHIRDHTIHCTSSPFLPFCWLCFSHCPLPLSHHDSTSEHKHLEILSVEKQAFYWSIISCSYYSTSLKLSQALLNPGLKHCLLVLPTSNLLPSLPIDFCQIFSPTISLETSFHQSH